MPVVRIANKICHFAHIPKCGGTSIESYFVKLGASVAFLDRRFLDQPEIMPWNISSPQHIDGLSLSRLFPNTFFDFGFAVVRNPYSRFLSAFKYQMMRRKIGLKLDINNFINNDLESAATGMGKYDNHFKSQTSFLLPQLSYKVFKLENGLMPVKRYIDSNFFDFPIALDIERKNQGIETNDKFAISMQSKNTIRHIYKDDFENFQYDLTES